jgi:hypothetical protein
MGIVSSQSRRTIAIFFSGIIELLMQDATPLLPPIPTAPMTDEEITRFTQLLIDTYWELRISNSVSRTQGIKNCPIHIPPVKDTATAPAQETTLKPEEEPSVPSSLEPEVVASQEMLSQPAVGKCFLHPKPKPSCSRCRAFLDWKLSASSKDLTKKSRLS